MENEDLKLIEETVQLYLDGLYYGDVEKLKLAFHPTASVAGYFKGVPSLVPLDAFLKRVSERKSPKESGEVYDMRIASIDTKGQVGFVKVEDLYIGLRFTDYLALYKVDGKWRIICKGYHHDPAT
jgi:hypothetical protein